MANKNKLDKSLFSVQGGDIASIAKYMQSKNCKNVFLMVRSSICTTAWSLMLFSISLVLVSSYIHESDSAQSWIVLG